MTPPPPRSMRRAAACATQNAPLRLVATTCSHWSAPMSTAGLRTLTPALSMSTSSEPICAKARVDLLPVADVADDHVRTGAACEDDDLAALVAKALRRRGADAAGAAGDDDLLAGKTLHRAPPSAVRDCLYPIHMGETPRPAPFIGVVSDTHSYYDEALDDLLAGAERIIHAGDVGTIDVLARLRALAPVTAVMGNTDIPFWEDDLPVGGGGRGAGPAHPGLSHRQEPHGAPRSGRRGLRPGDQRPQPPGRRGVARATRCSSTRARPARPASAGRARSPW